MKLLAVETSSIACSVALQVGDQMLERHAEQAREHTALLIPMINELLAEAGLETRELDALVLGNGPGSFIGLRIAASVVQGIAFASDLPVIPVSSFLAIATEAFVGSDASEVIVTADAHMNEVYLGHFGRDAEERVQALSEERLQPVAVIDSLSPLSGQVRLAAGAGWRRYPSLYNLNRAQLSSQSAVIHPRARYLLEESARLHSLGRHISAEAIAPAYLRKQVATPKPNP